MKRLGWITLAQKRRLHKTVLLHRIIKGNGPKILTEKLIDFNHTGLKTTRGTTGGNLYIPRTKTNYMKKSFFHDSARIWNSLPNELKAIDSNTKFKDKLQAYFFAAGA